MRGARSISVLFAVSALAVAAIPLLRAEPTPLAAQPFPDSPEYADAARQLATGNGYVTYVHGSEAQPPRYPPGYSVALAPFARWDHPEGTQLGAQLMVLTLLVVVWGVTWLLGGPLAAGLAAGLVFTSSFFRSMSYFVLSDPLSALLVVLSVGLVARPTQTRIVSAGVIIGASVVVRISNVVTLASLIATLPGRRPRALALAAGVPLVVVLLVYQWDAFGSPFETGYDYYLPGLREFALSFAWEQPQGRDGSNVVGDRLDGTLMSWACPCPSDGPMAAVQNALFYPAVMLGFFWMFTPPLVALLGFAELYRRRKSTEARYATAAIVSNVLLYTFYFHQAGRFMAPVGALLMVFSSVGAVTLGLPLAKRVAARLTRRVRRPTRLA